MFRIICVIGKHQDEDAAPGNALHNASSPVGSYLDVARSDPTSDPSGLELVANRLCNRVILTGMADKNQPATEGESATRVNQNFVRFSPTTTRCFGVHLTLPFGDSCSFELLAHAR